MLRLLLIVLGLGALGVLTYLAHSYMHPFCRCCGKRNKRRNSFLQVTPTGGISQTCSTAQALKMTTVALLRSQPQPYIRVECGACVSARNRATAVVAAAAPAAAFSASPSRTTTSAKPRKPRKAAITKPNTTRKTKQSKKDKTQIREDGSYDPFDL